MSEIVIRTQENQEAVAELVAQKVLDISSFAPDFDRITLKNIYYLAMS